MGIGFSPKVEKVVMGFQKSWHQHAVTNCVHKMMEFTSLLSLLSITNLVTNFKKKFRGAKAPPPIHIPLSLRLLSVDYLIMHLKLNFYSIFFVKWHEWFNNNNKGRFSIQLAIYCVMCIIWNFGHDNHLDWMEFFLSLQSCMYFKLKNGNVGGLYHHPVSVLFCSVLFLHASPFQRRGSIKTKRREEPRMWGN